MINNKRNWYLSIGILLIAAEIGINHFVKLPELVNGFALGLGIGLELIGVYTINNDMSRIKKFKRNILHAFLR
jgi:hypothetical protein